MTPTTNEELNENYFVNALARGLNVLAVFTPQQPELSMQEISAHTRLHQSTVFRLVHTLEHLGYLIRDEETKKYRQSTRMLTLSLASLVPLDIRKLAMPHLEELSRRTVNTSKLAVLDGTDVVFLDTVAIPGKVELSTPVGHRSPAHCTALGKALLAFQPPQRVDALIRMIDFKRHTEVTITDPEQFTAELHRVRRQGYAEGIEEYIPGMSSFAAPVFNYLGHAVAAVNLSGLGRTSGVEERRPQLVRELLQAARNISMALGYRCPEQGSVPRSSVTDAHSLNNLPMRR